MSREGLPTSSVERQRRGIENARGEIQVRKIFYAYLFRHIEGSLYATESNFILLFS